MAIQTETVAVAYLNVSAGVSVPCNFPLYDADEAVVLYGNIGLPATLNVDYTIDLADEDDFNTFTVTPLAPLITKINALIVIDPDEVNRIVIRRNVSLLTSAAPDLMRSTVFASRERDRVAMALIELREAIQRSVKLSDANVGVEALTITQILPGQSLIGGADGVTLEPGPNAIDIANAQANAAIAQAAADFIESVIDILTPANYYLKSEIDAQQSAQDTAISDRALKTTTIMGGGLVAGGGSLAANRTLTVTKSTNAQALAGTDDTTAMTPVRTKEAIASSVIGLGGQTWQNLTASRLINTIYQAPSDRGISVLVSIRQTPLNLLFQVSTDGATWVTVAASVTSSSDGQASTMHASVDIPPGNSYRVTGSGANIQMPVWAELR